MEKEVQYKIYKNPGGPDIGTVDAKVLEVDGKYFKDLAGTGELLPYEDWRLDAQTRAEDLAKRLSVEEIAGLMMYSSHQMVPFVQEGPFGATYDGKPFPESGKEKWALTDQQKKFLEEDHVRHVLVMGQENAEIAAKWNNQMQYFVERQPWRKTYQSGRKEWAFLQHLMWISADRWERRFPKSIVRLVSRRRFPHRLTWRQSRVGCVLRIHSEHIRIW